MTHPHETAIRANVIDYIVGDTSLDEFKDWIVGLSWELDEGDDPVLTDLAYGVLLTLSENNDEARIKDSLRSLASSIRVREGSSLVSVSGSSSVAFTDSLLLEPGRPAGRSLSMAPV